MSGDLAGDPQNGAVVDIVRTMADARRNKQPPKDTLAALRKIADANPGIPRLQLFIAQAYAQLGEFDEAESVASRAASRSPNDPDAARLLTQVYAMRPGPAKWAKVLDAARQWRQRSLDNPLPADLRIAHALLQMRRYADAVDQLKPHLAANAAADSNPALVQMYAEALIGAGRASEAATVLAPLAKRDAKWRQVWLTLGSAFNDAAAAMSWIEQVERSIPSENAVAEQLRLGDAWLQVGIRLSSTAALEKAKLILEPLAGNPQAGPAGLQLFARLCESTGDMPQAAAAYRKLLQAEPANPDYQNNLAYALLESGDAKVLPEARRLADAAVAKSPNNATYLDTLARCHLKAGDLPAAEQSFQRALQVERNSMDAMIGLADVHARAGRADKARELLARINDALRSGPALSPGLQRQLESVRQSVSPPLQSGRLD
jgi:predicted Zn-dependent protease